MKKKYLQKDIYPQNGGKNYWWPKINGKKLNEENYRWSKINISYNNSTSKNNTPNQSTQFRTKKWVEINDESRRTYNTNSQIRSETSMLQSSLCDYSDAYLLFKGTITVANTAVDRQAANNANKKVIFKNCAPFTSCISKINITQIDDDLMINILI